MYKELDEFITEYQNTVDFWYDVGCVMASEKLSKFTQNDWDELLRNIQNKPLEWKKKLVYCLDNTLNIIELEILLLLLNTDDEELFVDCIDTLRSFTLPESKQKILENPSIVSRVNDAMLKSGNATRKVLEDFLRQIQA